MTPNPIGTAQPQILCNAVEEVVEIWKQNAPKSTWWTRTTGAWFTAVGFLIQVIDYLVRCIDDVLDSGPDKKATVLKALRTIYNIIVPPLLPIWLKPFNHKIRTFVIYVVASLMIDFIVGKYRDADWRKDGLNNENDTYVEETIEEVDSTSQQQSETILVKWVTPVLKKVD